jgi:peroxiredoxin
MPGSPVTLQSNQKIMKTTITFLAAVLMACTTFTSCHASVTKIASPTTAKDTTSHTMLHPDSNTVYLDTAGKKIDSKLFTESLKSGKFTFVPDMKGSKVISIKLKASELKVTMGSMAPLFAGTDLNGHSIDLKALKGKTVVLNFWFTSCAPCMAEMPEMNDMVAKYKKDSSVVFVAVTYNSPEEVKAFLKRKEFKFNILAGRSDIIKQYGISGYPTSMVIDKTGNIAFSLTTYDGTNVAQLDGVIGALKNVK